MPKVLAARPPLDAPEAAQVRRLARSLHASADGVLHARMIARSWDGLRTRAIAPRSWSAIPRRCARCDVLHARGRDGLGMQPGSGRQPRLRGAARRAVIALVARVS
jgi:hypothetical protein